jgi:MFS family permease
LGANQGLAWSMTVVMKIDLAGPRRRGLALGLNESAGYLGVAATAFGTGALATTAAPRTVVWIGALVIVLVGLLGTVAFVRDTAAHVAHEQSGHGERAPLALRNAFVEASVRNPVLRACAQAGLVNNLNDALAWALVPLYLAASGASVAEIGAVAAVYPAVWGSLQIATGWLSDSIGRRPLITLGMLVQALALGTLTLSGGDFAIAMVAAALLGIGTALVYPTLLAAVSDVAEPRDRASVIGVYRFWRDSGFVVGALLVGFAADAVGSAETIALVAGMTGLSGVLVAVTPWRTSPQPMSGIGKLPLADGLAGPKLGRQKGGEMRAIDCPCGHHLEGADDEDLFRLARDHVNRDHPEMQRTDEQLRERVANDAYDV